MNKMVEVSINKITRESILEILREVGQPLNERVLELSLKSGKIDTSKKAVKEALFYLVEKGLIYKANIAYRKLGIKMDTYCITAKGIDYLEETIEVEGLGDE